MRLTFRIHYHTQWGEQIRLLGSLPELGADELSQAAACSYLGDGLWEYSFESAKPPRAFHYHYLLIGSEGQVLNRDWGAPRQAKLPQAKLSNILFQDFWRNQWHPENAFYTSAFSEVIFRSEAFVAKKSKANAKKGRLRIQVRAPRVPQGQQLCVCGNAPEFGDWDFEKPLLLGNEAAPLWSAEIFTDLTRTIEYKYGYYDPAQKKVTALEAGDNRQLAGTLLPRPKEALVVSDEYFSHPQGPWKGAGVAMPVFALRSEQGLGVGEFTDIPLLIDWAASVGLKMVQILPINDTSNSGTWVDSYPYACLSTYALHPLYLNVAQTQGRKKIIDVKALAKAKAQLNALPEVDYEAVMSLKLELARQVFEKDKKALYKKADFKKFLTDNNHWLPAYALFCVRRDQNGTTDFQVWEQDAVFSQAALDQASNPKSKEYDKLAFYYFLQYHLDQQLKAASDYARSKGILLKGDIPIGIYRYSVDAWREPELFNMNGQSGAPPDPFSDSGQNWGFPTYNWEEMAKDGYQWWQNRLLQLSRYFDSFRIDHILGFFRIWQIPLEQVEGTMGFFNPALPIGVGEFGIRGIGFDYERFCRPYITAALLWEWFGDHSEYVRNTFLDSAGGDRFALKSNFNTQRKIEAFLIETASPQHESIKQKLYDLVSNVLFFEVPESKGREFHPRIDFSKTASFKALAPSTRDRLMDLYNDYFYHRQEDFWRNQAMTKLPVIKAATNMLICGEDLGMVPDCVPGVMSELGILTLEIQRMSKNPKTEFLQAEDIPYLSVCSPSTHDMATVRGWWEEMEIDQRQRFCQQEMGVYQLPPQFCEPWVAERIIRQHLFWPGMWAVFPLQDLLAMDGTLRRENPAEERINVPANPKHYWRYRLHLPLEELAEAEDFNGQLTDLLSVTGR